MGIETLTWQDVIIAMGIAYAWLDIGLRIYGDFIDRRNSRRDKR